ncbi:primosomal protein N' [Alkalisalibacterium limincola]|uniref:Replication restart protein PriA n=1 Tax=Alkalisalibacterium limincola TaxID=2699169 RepID=A0A5C8KJW4_9GAMM|nr:primosomal protein N' [Alkalisalibacterium limincola]TXK59728.1 primosomal protein N' [Alkalisalibacterium limincola]
MLVNPPARCLRVALPVPLPRVFDYLPPPGLEVDEGWVGCRVRVGFGRRELVGLVEAVAVSGGVPSESLKPVLERIDAKPLLPEELLATLRWVSGYYHAPLGEVLATALPADLRQGAPLPDTGRFAWALSEAGATGLERLRRGARPRQLAERLQAGAIAEDTLELEATPWREAMRSLQQRGLVVRQALQAVPAMPLEPGGVTLNGEQATAAQAIVEGLGRFHPVLLEGVTGSGKTEVYLDAIRACLAQGRQALVLVPEIGLTPQTLQRFERGLGIRVHALHSNLADGERARTWTAMARGEAQVVVGTRSAIFSPLPRPGLIVVDEEHDASYKQQDGVRYSARDLALVRARALSVPVVLGSATPSLESLAQAGRGLYRHLGLSQRAGAGRAPPVRVLDVRKRRLESGLSGDMLDAIAACLARGEQALVFRNRRGYAPVLLCHDCGWSAECPRCDARMTVHGRGRQLICHHCGARRRPPTACPDCGSLGLQPQGAGTERIEDALAERFPEANLVRVDRESTRQRDGLSRQLQKLGDGAGILVGTQMLAKGHDLARLSLVCVVGIDEGLFSADFRAPERLAQLLIQVSGRAGRAEVPGEVLLQTHHPEHPLLATLLQGGYPAFARLALEERELAGFPPFAHLALLRADAAQEAALQGFLNAARTCLEGPARDAAGRPGGQRIGILGPLPAPMPRRAGRVRAQLLVSSPSRPALQACLAEAVPRLYDLPQSRKVRWSIDVDPVDLY